MSDHEQLETEARSGSASRDIDQDDVSERLDDDKLSGEFPPEEPVAVDEYGITPQEQRVPEPIEERAEREQPEAETAPELEPDMSAEEAAMHLRPER